MSTVMSRRTMLTATAAAAAGAALGGASGVTTIARAAALPGRAAAAPAPPAGRARVGATVNPHAYQKGTSLTAAMRKFDSDVGRDFEVAKRYYGGPATWPAEGNLGVGIRSLINRGCRGLLCFEPATDGSDLKALVASLTAIKARLPDAKVTLYQEQGLGAGLSAADFKQAYAKYSDAVNAIYPLFVDFSGSQPKTWADYRPAGVKGIAVDFYADAWVRQAAGNADPLGLLAQWADEAGQELGIWEIGNTASAAMPTADQVRGYFAYLTSLQAKRLDAGHLVGDMAWYNGPHKGSYDNTISGTKLNPLYQTDRNLLDSFFTTFNGTA